MDPMFYLIAGTGLLLFVLLLLWISGNKPKFIPDFPIQLAPRKWTKKQLYEIAKEHNIDGRSKMSRDRLLRVTTGLRPKTRPFKEEKPGIKPKKSFKLSGSELIGYKKEGFRVAGKMGRELRDIRRLSPDTTFTGKFDPNTMTFIVESGEKIKPPTEVKRIEEKEKIQVKREQRLEERKPKVKKPSKRQLAKELQARKQKTYDDFLANLSINERKKYPSQQFNYEKNIRQSGDGRLARYRKKKIIDIVQKEPGVSIKRKVTPYKIVTTTLEEVPPKRKKKMPPSIDMSEATSDERLDALIAGKRIKGATMEERKSAREMAEMKEIYEKFGTAAVAAALERKDQQVLVKREWRKPRRGASKLTFEEKQIMKEHNITPFEAKAIVARAEMKVEGQGLGKGGADLTDISSMSFKEYESIVEGFQEIEKDRAMTDFIAESYAAEWSQQAPKRRFFPSINPNIIFRLSRNKQKNVLFNNRSKKLKGDINNG